MGAECVPSSVINAHRPPRDWATGGSPDNWTLVDADAEHRTASAFFSAVAAMENGPWREPA
jgi:hypothetical protein